ncbi:Na+/H+ antiporter [Runella sp. SP2]|uniref:Na+/H+ antiporter n=1 Tax=Runella sp. SP2 TaxID=2268026 RepID=UPI000F08F738|nr:Na+/H+ antiporter [Runella sp. SP2]AYQ32869.1 Na+/H+ antiporter [Runella sp. SP2]
MIEHFPFFLTLIVVILLLIMLADRIKVAYPVLLVITGLIISFFPGIPKIQVKPELIFIIFLPPLLYDAAFAMSWKELWRWRRIVGSFAFVVVFLTALSVALVANWCIPGISLALGFLLGGIVSPPDAVSASAILKFVKLPRRMSSIMEGESLLNDASSLIIFRFAMLTVATGQFVWHEAALSFGWMVVGGSVIGLAVGWLFMKAHQLLPTDANIDIVLSFVTPYVMYIAAEEVHSSGVLAVVSGGLLLANRRHIFLSSSSRLRGVNVWQSFVFVLNGVVFLLIGLDLPEIHEGLKQEGIALPLAIGYGLVITAVLIIGRIVASFGAVVTTKIMSHFIQVADSNPGWKAPVVLSWSGMRGVVSLAAALSIPVEVNGVPFPHRNLILFITFVVILTTLVVQGLTLPWLIKKLELPDYGDYLPEEETEAMLKRGMAEHSLQYFHQNYRKHLVTNEILRTKVAFWEQKSHEEPEELTEETKRIYLDVLEQQRLWLQNKNNTDDKIDEEIVRKLLHGIDLDEEKLKYS